MAGLDLTAVMDGLAAAVQTKLASGRTAYAWPVEGVLPGDALVGYPTDPLALTMTYRRGADRASLPVFVICGLPQDRTTRDAIADWITGAGAVVEAIEGYAGPWQSVAVTGAAIVTYEPVGMPEQLAIRFDCDIID